VSVEQNEIGLYPTPSDVVLYVASSLRGGMIADRHVSVSLYFPKGFGSRLVVDRSHDGLIDHRILRPSSRGSCEGPAMNLSHCIINTDHHFWRTGCQ